MVAGAVAGFAIYTFGWREGSTSSERQARAYAEVVAAACDPRACQVKSVVRISGNDWKVVLLNPASGNVACALLQTKRFAQRAGGDFAGASSLKCPEARTAPDQSAAAPGPEWWSEDVARQKLEHSKWAFDGKVGGAVFDCIGKGESRADGVYRRFACTYEYGGPNVDQSGRVEIEVTGRDSFRVLTR